MCAKTKESNPVFKDVILQSFRFSETQQAGLKEKVR